MTKRTYFTDETYAFLAELKANNERDWFNSNKDRYEQHLKAPMISFIGDFAGPLEKISKHFVADTRGNGGSMFRIYRDVRFSKNKDPYKTHLAAQFRHERANDVHAPGFYLHIESGNNIFGAGIWRPDKDSLFAIRNRIIEKPREWQHLVKSVLKHGNFQGDSLKRGPAGFDKDHPLIEDIKRKDFISVATADDATILSDNFMNAYANWCQSQEPLMQFICNSLELEW